MSIKSIAFIGLGAMGAPMAENLVKRQFRVTGFDMRQEARQALVNAGGHAADSAKAAATGADALVLMVVNAAQARSVLFEAGALEALAPSASVFLMATCPPGEAEAIAAAVEKTGRHLVDAPVSGGIAGARGATLTIMVGATQESFALARPVLDAMGDKVFHVGFKPGQGATVKTVNQLLCGVHIAAAAEALSLAEKAGIDGALLFEIMGGSAASSWMLKDRGPRMLLDDAPIASAVDIFVKDLGIVLDAGRSAKTALPLAAAAHQMFLASSGLGHGARDDSQVVRAYRALNAKPANDP
ncbi:NAD(P)-dependent oxidoreductase [Bosea caraganae]|uniref:NAD(P)-dependent oxidoreductase n=1 Tax=Bosea caraganae TaxID=2763117 RepID=A0A370L2K5_9HYPH|nr:NAD(P)-binding domain-containing protein [Bosea caraganae]RDJ22475.1 NAD(P)-dependent oxidoreductase [Bosea caraganae]RDJ30434.1 NAD(P)-dependent oxidoreductase [Bosea caraganae]